MSTRSTGRRQFASSLVLVGGAAIAGCRPAHEEAKPRPGDEDAEAVITPGEDLMREHGVLERVLVVWSESDAPLRRGDVDVTAIRSSVELVQRFVEAYHERQEEDLVFPRLVQAGRERELVRTLREQHDAGRGITAEVWALLAGRPDESARVHAADRLAAYRRMYLAHASREDTIVFPILREITGTGYAELGDQLEEREREIVGEGGFERAVAEVARIERALGLDALSRFTPEQSA